RTTYTAAQLTPGGGTAADVLRKVPVLEVDAEGRVSLRGDPNVVVQLNGRATGLSATQLAIFLRQLPAGMVQKVDVIPNPSARYDPDGMSGIVDITLKQRAELGTSGGATVQAGTADKYNASGNLGWQRGAVTVFGTLAYTADQHPQTGLTLSRPLASSTPTLAQTMDGEAWQRAVTLNTTAELKLGARDVLASQLIVARQTGGGTSNSLYRRMTDGGAWAEAADNTADRTFGNGNLSLTHTLGGGRGTVSLQADYFRSPATSRDVFDRGAPAGQTPTILTRAWAGTSQRGLVQADATLTPAAGIRLEAGYKGLLRRMDQDASTETIPAGSIDGGVVERMGLRYDQAQHAAYAMATRQGGGIQLQAGLRAEHAANTFIPADGGERFRAAGLDLFPSALAAVSVGGGGQLRASYGRRVVRPELRTLVPWRSYDDPRHATEGNPYLRPEYTDAFELGYQHSGRLGSVQLAPYYRRTVNAIGPRRAVDGAGVTVTTFENFSTRTTWGADLSGSLRGTRLSGFGGVSAYHAVVDAGNVEPGRSVAALAWSARASATWKPGPQTEVQGTVGYRAPFQSVAGRFGAYVTDDVALRRTLGAGRAAVTLRLTDPLGLTRYELAGIDPESVQLTTRHFGTRAAYVGFSYTVGSAPRVRAQPDPAAQNRPADPAAGG
ncbi:MAG TPA: outer membrane beta-barrel family protein, partial [Longimicrobium sp.]|nr:outer membrane beta-barrel family protein [Longimicrobium sp.]